MKGGELMADQLPIVGCNIDGFPILQWTPEIQTTVISVYGGRGRLIIARCPDVYQYPDGTGGTYTDGWCYDEMVFALCALALWNPLEAKGGAFGSEPDGWRKHVTTGRYRLDCLAEFEYRTYDEQLEVEARYRDMMA